MEREAASAKRVAVVTGAARGIGLAIARAFASAGTTTVIFDVDGEATEEAAGAIRESGAEVRARRVDVSRVALVAKAIDEVVGELGSIDILVNNAGILNTTRIERLTEAEWDRTMAVNLKGAVFAAQAAVKHMIARGWGRVVNISSMAGRMGGFSTGCAYSASKAALIGFTMCLARQIAATGVTVNAVAPGPTNTEMALGFTESERRKLESLIPVGRMIEPESIAETVRFLVSDAAQFITGAVIDVNGGTFMG